VRRCELNETRDERELKVVTVVTVECERDNQADLKMKTLFFYWILMYHTTCVPRYTRIYMYAHIFIYHGGIYYTCVKSKKVKCV
jgi:hypothetical protein